MDFSRRAPGDEVGSSDNEGGEGGLSASWVIALVIVLLLVLGTVIGVAIWHSRRMRRRRMEQLDGDSERSPPLHAGGVSPYGLSLKRPPPVATSEPKRPPSF
ncbi:hypothetical protein FB45DRAFT_1058124 [Roridomyces roridus]|uniref:Uncharacterized protein n=1 Tax=Roridomyces roridus TaxID=1738132 RepID=A0AAD7BXQ4_9AGAR|nr:hypothetical protein FB45DRAFT_1058124 [Roridomyces roridus]